MSIFLLAKASKYLVATWTLICLAPLHLWGLPASSATQSVSSPRTIEVSTAVPSMTIRPGDTNVPLTVTLGSSDYTGPISVTLTNLPSGVSVAPLTLFAGGTGTLAISASVAADQEAFNPTVILGANDFATTNVSVVAFGGAYNGSSNLSLTVSLENPSFKPTPAQINLPILTIDTAGQDISSKTPGTITITSADGTKTYLGSGGALPDGTATLSIHGNTTALMSKKPYEFALTTSGDLLSAMGLQCGYVTSSGKPACDKSKHFILLANYDDKSFLRDWAASALANAIPSGAPFLASPAGSPSPTGTKALAPWAPHSLFVELYLNGRYDGVYQLIEDIRVDSHRVNISELSASNTSPSSITGGYLLEIDQHQKEDFVFFTPGGLPIGLLDPDFSPEVPEQTTYIQNYVDAAETALFSPQFTDPKLGWRAYFDEAAAVNFYIVNDLMGNVDGGDFYSSDFLYKDANNPLLYMGPVWDFDLSGGNVNNVWIVSALTPWMPVQSPWYAQFFKDPSFTASVTKQWNALKQQGVLASWITSITQQSKLLEQAQANNFNRWPMQGIEVWENALATGTYDSEVSYLTNWLNLRAGYLDSIFNTKPATATTIQSVSGYLVPGGPVTVTAQVTGGSPSGVVSFEVSCHVDNYYTVFGTALLQSDGTATISLPNLPKGWHEVRAIYNGDSQTALSASSFAIFTVADPLTPAVLNLTSSTATAISGDSVTLTADLVANAVANAPTAAPTGQVTFFSNGQPLGTAQLSTSGIASLAVTNAPVGIDTLTAQYSGDSTFQIATSNPVPLTVKPPLQIPVITWPNPTQIKYGTALSTQQLNATANTPGTFVYSPPLGTILPAGTDTLGVTFTPADPTAYTTQTASASLVVSQLTPFILWLPHIMSNGVGLSSQELDPRTDVPGTFTYSPTLGTVLNVGLHVLTATFTPTDATDYTTSTVKTLVLVRRN